MTSHPPVSLCRAQPLTANRRHLASGRAVIAMAAVRRGACQQPSEITDHPDLRSPTDAMSSHPYLRGVAARGHVGMVTRGVRGDGIGTGVETARS